MSIKDWVPRSSQVVGTVGCFVVTLHKQPRHLSASFSLEAVAGTRTYLPSKRCTSKTNKNRRQNKEQRLLYKSIGWWVLVWEGEAETLNESRTEGMKVWL